MKEQNLSQGQTSETPELEEAFPKFPKPIPIPRPFIPPASGLYEWRMIG